MIEVITKFLKDNKLIINSNELLILFPINR